MASAFAFAIWLLKTIENLCPLFVEANPNGQPRSIRLDLFRLAPWAASGAVICGHFQIFQIFQGITHYIWRETATECKRTQERLLSVFMPGISFVLRSLQSGMQPRMSQPTAKCKAYFSKKTETPHSLWHARNRTRLLHAQQEWYFGFEIVHS